MGEPQITVAVAAVLRHLLDTPPDEHYGAAIQRATRIKGGTVYPILIRLENAGWITGGWEAGTAAEHGRPLRMLYRIQDPDAVREALDGAADVVTGTSTAAYRGRRTRHTHRREDQRAVSHILNGVHVDLTSKPHAHHTDHVQALYWDDDSQGWFTFGVLHPRKDPHSAGLVADWLDALSTEATKLADWYRAQAAGERIAVDSDPWADVAAPAGPEGETTP